MPGVAGNQAVAKKFLQGGNVLGVEQFLQKPEPPHRLGRIGVICHRQTVADNLWFPLGECSIQEQRTVGKVYAIRLREKIVHLRFQLQYLQNVADLLGDVVDCAEFEAFINLTSQGQIVC